MNKTIFNKLPNERWKRAVVYFLLMYIPNSLFIVGHEESYNINQQNLVIFLAIAIALSFVKKTKN